VIENSQNAHPTLFCNYLEKEMETEGVKKKKKKKDEESMSRKMGTMLFSA
jgi:hypothetical protein